MSRKMGTSGGEALEVPDNAKDSALSQSGTVREEISSFSAFVELTHMDVRNVRESLRYGIVTSMTRKRPVPSRSRTVTSYLQ